MKYYRLKIALVSHAMPTIFNFIESKFKVLEEQQNHILKSLIVTSKIYNSN